MRNSLYYGEVVSRITDHLLHNPDHKIRIDQIFNQHHDPNWSIYIMCAEAARVFQGQDDLLGNIFMDWRGALDNYSACLLDVLLMGRVPDIPNMLSMSADSIENAA